MKTTFILLTSIIVTLFTATLFFAPVEAGTRCSPDKLWDLSDDSMDYRMDGGGGGSITEDDCRLCHEDLQRFPGLINTNPDKHHLLVGQEIQQPTIAPYETSGANHECLSCHLTEQVDVMDFQVSVERDCLQCHPVETVTGRPRGENVHHDLDSYRCRDCHSRMR